MAHHWQWSELETNKTVEVLRPRVSPRRRHDGSYMWVCHSPYTDPWAGISPAKAYEGWRYINAINFSERQIDVRII